MNNVEKKENDINYNIITIVQIIMSIIVIGIHTNPFKNVDNKMIVTLWNTISLLAVPFFFFTSAWFFADKLATSTEKDGKNLTKGQLLKYVKIYIIWNIIYLPITFYSIVEKFDDYGWMKTILYYIYGIFIKGEQYYSWPLWYLLSISYAFFFIYIIKKLFKKEKMIFIHGFGVINEKALSIFNTLFSDRPFKGFYYISFGILMYKYKDKIFNNLKMDYCLLGFIFFFIMYCFSVFNGNLNYLFRPICSSLLFIIIIKIAHKDKNNLSLVSKYSLRKVSIVMYYTHMIFFFLYGLITNSLNKSEGINAFMVCLVGTTIMSIIVIHFKENRLFKTLF